MRRIHLDHNSTSPLRPEARERWLEVADAAGNPSSLHASGRRARAWIDEARARVAAALGAREEEIVFTSGGTEANNLALFGALEAAGPGASLVTSALEHSSVLEPAQRLAERGHPRTLLPATPRGLPDLDALERRLAGAPVALVSLAAANNEIGSVLDLAQVAERLGAARSRPLLHADAVQMLGRLPVDLAGWGVDLATFSAHKVGGPPGVGVLWRRAGVALRAQILGGAQEAGLRAGTESAAAIAAAAVAIELAVREQRAARERLSRLSRLLWRELAGALPTARLVGPPIDAPDRLPNTLLLLLEGVEGRVLVTRLDLEGLEASAGSACASGSLEPSHVLVALGLDDASARAGLRLSLGRETTGEDCREAVEILARVGARAHAS